MPIQVRFDGQSAFDSILDAFAELMSYRCQKARYESDCQVREECRKLREAVFLHDSRKAHVTVVELARCKRKLERLRREVENTEEPLKIMFKPLLSELEDRVEELRRIHRTK